MSKQSTDIGTWLANLGLGEYARVFAENDIDFEVLANLSDEHLKELGISLGHRVKLRKAIDGFGDLPVGAGANPSEPRSDAAPIPHAVDAERRQLTVMFCDLVDSTALSEQIDPEDLRDLLRAYQDTCRGVVERYEGTVSRSFGDGLLIYFGYPVAHEDDPRRAVLTGLKLVDAVSRLKAGAAPLAVRIGIHTGMVVVGGIRSHDTLDPLAVTGETPNLAARLQGFAGPNRVVVSAITRQLAGDACEFQSLGMHPIRGLTREVELYTVEREIEQAPGAPHASAHSHHQVVGRSHELGLLLDRWEQVKRGAPQVVLLSGEPGVGKSRLLRECAERLRSEDMLRIECRCSSFHRHSPFYPLIDLIQREMGLQPEDSPEARRDKLEHLLERLGLDPENKVPLLAPLVSAPLGARYAAPNLTPERRRAETVAALLAIPEAMAAQKPMVFVVEDLHWVDPSTLELLGQLIERRPRNPMLVLCTFRPDFAPPWLPYAHVTQLTLGNLTPEQARTLAGNVAGDRELPAEVVNFIVGKTDGVPLFIEELTKFLLESGVLGEYHGQSALGNRLASLAIPTTLRDLLTARLDRLGAAKQTAQLAATAGREFTRRLLEACSRLDASTLGEHLAQLTSAELIYERGVAPRLHYMFKHALIQDTAYGSLLKQDRKMYHGRIAEVLEHESRESGIERPELLAYHFTEVGLNLKAASYRHAAGQLAVERSAVKEAINQLSTGLALLKDEPESNERLGLELKLNTTLAMPLAAAKGYAAPEVEHTLERGRELAQRLGDPRQLFQVLHGLCKIYDARGGHDTVEEIGRQLLQIADDAGDESQLLEAHRTLGLTCTHLGRFDAGRTHMDRALALYDPVRHRSHAFTYAVEPAVVCLSYSAWCLWSLGHMDRALERTRRALEQASGLGHPYTEAYAHCSAATHFQFRKDPRATLEHADRAIALAMEHGYPFWLGWALVPKGWALCELGEVDKGLPLIEKGLAGYRAAGVGVSRALRLALHAEALMRAQRPQEALATVDDALEFMRGKRDMYLAELQRLRGELLRHLHPTQAAEAETCFVAAREQAVGQDAQSLELRAVLSLARLWRERGRTDDAMREVEAISRRFNEGLDTPDLQEMRMFLSSAA